MQQGNGDEGFCLQTHGRMHALDSWHRANRHPKRLHGSTYAKALIPEIDLGT